MGVDCVLGEDWTIEREQRKEGQPTLGPIQPKHFGVHRGAERHPHDSTRNQTCARSRHRYFESIPGCRAMAQNPGNALRELLVLNRAVKSVRELSLPSTKSREHSPRAPDPKPSGEEWDTLRELLVLNQAVKSVHELSLLSTKPKERSPRAPGPKPSGHKYLAILKPQHTAR
ncbi:hypothetical protein LR48_Vigan05g228600 [Vigna angularis]|uniref:Uncharacterized protein n=1 Tax=Phaseolus angularis TaxID=3914 RepID=A0A0L9UPN8_PHAAN|nr:hypothetical protein LR48_Vigan05g228600 [Vigna angularis]